MAADSVHEVIGKKMRMQDEIITFADFTTLVEESSKNAGFKHGSC